MKDPIEKSLRDLKAEPLKGREGLTESEKEALIHAIGGPLTTETICKAMTSLPKERIPFLFSSLDPQLVADVLANDMKAAIERLKKPRRERNRRS